MDIETTDRPTAVADRRARRAGRRAATRRRTSRVAGVLLLLGAAVTTVSLFSIEVGGAVGSVTVTPNSGLIDGQQVTVSWTGLTPNFSPIIEQCKTAPTNPTSDCDFLTLLVSDSNSSGAGSDTFNVFGGQGPSGLFACDDQHACTIRVADDPNDLTSGAVAAITLSTAATTTSSSSSTSSSSTSSTSSTSSSSSTSSTSTSDSSSTSSTTAGADDSTTTTTPGAEVLGTDTSSGSGGSGSDMVLAFTGTALHLPFTLFAGGLLLVTGLVLRRFALAPLRAE